MLRKPPPFQPLFNGPAALINFRFESHQNWSTLFSGNQTFWVSGGARDLALFPESSSVSHQTLSTGGGGMMSRVAGA
jgi:hypothetical protein